MSIFLFSSFQNIFSPRINSNNNKKKAISQFCFEAFMSIEKPLRASVTKKKMLASLKDQRENIEQLNPEYYKMGRSPTNITKKIEQVKDKAKFKAKINEPDPASFARNRLAEWKRRSLSDCEEVYENVLKMNSIKSPILHKLKNQKEGRISYKTEQTEGVYKTKTKTMKLHEERKKSFESRFEEVLQKTRQYGMKIQSTRQKRNLGSPSKVNAQILFSPRMNTYYLQQLVKNYKQRQSLCHYHIQTNIEYAKMFKNVEQRVFYSKQLHRKKLTLNKNKKYQNRKTIIFDLDETLIHCNDSLRDPCDVKCLIKTESSSQVVHINVRPYAKELLRKLSENFQIMIFTASSQTYADEVIKILDPNDDIIQHRLYRQHCTLVQNKFMKDLRVINRSPEQMVLIDNAGYSYEMQKENGIPIIPFYRDAHDKELRSLQKYLNSLTYVKDVRDKNKRTFKLHRYGDFETPQELIEKLYIYNF